MAATQLSGYRVTADSRQGSRLLAHDKFEIRKAKAFIKYAVGAESRELSLIGEARAFEDERGTTLELISADKLVRARTLIIGKPGDASLEVVCELSLADPTQSVRIAEFVLLSFDVKNTFLGPDAPEEVLFRGEAPDAWTNAGNKRLNQPPEHLEFRNETSYLSGGYFHRRKGKGIFAYHILPHQWIDMVRNESGCMTVAQKVDAPLRNLEVLRSDRLLLNFTEPVNEALASMAAHQKCRRRTDEVTQHIAWNSCDYYKENISHDSIMADFQTIKSIPWMRDRVKYIVIDGFWEELVGDWEPKPARNSPRAWRVSPRTSRAKRLRAPESGSVRTWPTATASCCAITRSTPFSTMASRTVGTG